MLQLGLTFAVGSEIQGGDGDGPVSGERIVRNLIGDFRTSATQTPAGAGQTNKIRVNFGAGGNTTGNEFTVAADGTITCNQAGNFQYLFVAVVRLKRLGGGGNSQPMLRALYSADGSETDTVQLGWSFGVLIDDADTVWREEFDVPLAPAQNSKIWLEFARDESENNSGEIGAVQPTGSLLTDTPAWEPVASAILEIRDVRVA